MALIDQPLCSFSTTALPLESLLVQDWRGEEALSRPYRFEVRLASLNPLLDDEAMLGQPASLTLFDAMGLPEPYHGVVSEVEQLDSDDQYFYFRVVLEPRMALLRQQRFSEIWLDKSLPELIRAVLADSGLLREGPGPGGGSEAGDYDFDIRLAQDDLALESVNFTCQFEETSFAFLSRLLEYYGVYYFFEQQAGHEVLVLCGDLRYQPQIPTLVTYYPLHSALDMAKNLAVTRSFKRRLTSQSSRVMLQDFSASDAQLQLQASASIAEASLSSTATVEHRASAEASPAFQGEYGLYGQHFGSNKEGFWLATRRAQAIGCRHREFQGSGRASGVRAGYPMQLLGHPRLTLNVTYQVIEVQHDGSQPLPGLGEDRGDSGDCNTRFIALPGDVQFRALCLTPRPHVQGLLSAVVDGDGDSTRPLLNAHGCYKVSFPFIRSDKKETRGSAWLRMATMSNGSSHGMAFPLLKGSEVLVSFLGGDPDRPVITGSIPNSENPARVTTSNATQSGLITPGGHYLAMEDSASGPMMAMGAPAGNTKLILGEGSVSGAHLRTDNHMQLSSSSYKHEIPSMYFHNIGGGSADVSDPDAGGSGSTTSSADSNAGSSGSTTRAQGTDDGQAAKDREANDARYEKKKTDDLTWESKGKYGAKNWLRTSASFTPSWSVKLESTIEQTSASIGLLKQSLGVMGHELAVSIAGPKTSFTLNPGKSEFKHGLEAVFAARAEKLLNSQKSHVNELKEAVNATVKTGTHVHTTVALVTFSCGPHSISLTPAGISINSAIPLCINADVSINGNLVVSGMGVFRNSTTMERLTVGNSISAAQINCVSLKSLRSQQAVPVVPPVTVPGAAMMVAMKTVSVAQRSAEAASKAVNATAEAENFAAQIARALSAIAT